MSGAQGEGLMKKIFRKQTGEEITNVNPIDGNVSDKPKKCRCYELPVADLHSKILERPPGSKFFQFRVVFGKFWRNRMLAAPTSGKSWTCHWFVWLSRGNGKKKNIIIYDNRSIPFHNG